VARAAAQFEKPEEGHAERREFARHQGRRGADHHELEQKLGPD
jgi:hypothetical protein